jgi:MFS superfamily sulfate permease-like transporter
MSLDRWVQRNRAAHSYRRRWLRADIVAGLVLAAILVPQGMAYAELAGLPAVTGLYTTIACLVAYAVFGPSRVLVLGPDSSISPLILAAITPLLVVDDPGKAIVLAGMLAVLVGIIEIGLGLAKLGFVADLLSSEVQVGYMNGLAITIIVSQLPKLFGFSTDADGFVDELRAFFDHLDQTKAGALAVGVGVLVVLLVLPRISRIPAVLVAVAGATIVSAVLDLAADGVRRSAPSPGLPNRRSVDVVRRRRYPSRCGDRHRARLADRHHRDRVELRRPARDELQPNQEMIGIGTANVARVLQGFAISDQRIAHRGGGAVGRSATDRRRRRASSRSCSCSSTAPVGLPQSGPAGW